MPYYNTNEIHRDYIIMIFLFKRKINITPSSKRDVMVNNWQNLYHRLQNTGSRALLRPLEIILILFQIY